MATVIPNSTNRAMENLSQMMIQVMLENRRFGQEQQRIDISQQQANTQAQSQAMSTLNSLQTLGLMPMGKSIAEMPQLHGLIKQAFPDFDPANPGDLGSIVLTPETLEGLLKPLELEYVNRMPEEQRQQFLQRRVNATLLGTPSSDAELGAQATRAEVFSEAVETIRSDPQAWDNVMRTQTGLDPIIRVQYKGRELQFDTTQAASLTTALMQHDDQMGLGWANYNLSRQRMAQEGQGRQIDLAGELMKQVENMGINLGRAGAAQIVRAYDLAGKMAQEGTLTEQNNPLAALAARSPELSAAVQVFQGAASFGENQFERVLASSPEGQQFLNFTRAGEMLMDAGLEREQIPRALEGLSEVFSQPGPGGQPGALPGYRAPGMLRRGAGRLNFAPTPSQQEAPVERQSGPSREALRSQMNQAAEDLAAGRINVVQVNRTFADPAQRAAVVRQSQVIRRRNQQ